MRGNRIVQDDGGMLETGISFDERLDERHEEETSAEEEIGRSRARRTDSPA